MKKKSPSKSCEKDLFNIKIELEDEEKAKPTTLTQHFAVCAKYIKALNLRLYKYVSLRVYYFSATRCADDDVMQNGFGWR